MNELLQKRAGAVLEDHYGISFDDAAPYLDFKSDRFTDAGENTVLHLIRNYTNTYAIQRMSGEAVLNIHDVVRSIEKLEPTRINIQNASMLQERFDPIQEKWEVINTAPATSLSSKVIYLTGDKANTCPAKEGDTGIALGKVGADFFYLNSSAQVSRVAHSACSKDIKIGHKITFTSAQGVTLAPEAQSARPGVGHAPSP